MDTFILLLILCLLAGSVSYIVWQRQSQRGSASGSGKSLFMNMYNRGEHVCIIDVGDSYEGLCSIIRDTLLVGACAA